MLTAPNDFAESFSQDSSFASDPSANGLISRGWLRRAVIALTAAYLAAAVALVERRALGAFRRPVSLETLTAVAITLVVIGEALRASLARFNSPEPRTIRWWSLAPALGSLLIAAAISLSGSSAAGLLILWTLVLAHAAWTLSLEIFTKRRVAEPRAPLATSTADLNSSPDHAGKSSSDGASTPRGLLHDEAEHDTAYAETIDRPESSTGLDSDVVQQLLRRKEPDGSEWLSGSLRVDFAVGQRVASAHVAFCPPFVITPDCEAESIDGPDCQVKVSQLVPHGARFEVRLDRPAPESVSVLLDFAAHAESSTIRLS